MKRFLRIAMPILTFLLIVFIFSNSLSNGEQAGAKRDFFVKLFTEKNLSPRILTSVAKLFHMMEYAAFSFCLTGSVYLLGDGLKNRFERILLCGMTLAIADEMIQTLFSGRGSRLTDVLVDTAGVMIGYAVSFLIVYCVQKKKGTF